MIQSWWRENFSLWKGSKLAAIDKMWFCVCVCEIGECLCGAAIQTQSSIHLHPMPSLRTSERASYRKLIKRNCLPIEDCVHVSNSSGVPRTLSYNKQSQPKYTQTYSTKRSAHSKKRYRRRLNIYIYIH